MLKAQPPSIYLEWCSVPETAAPEKPKQKSKATTYKKVCLLSNREQLSAKLLKPMSSQL